MCQFPNENLIKWAMDNKNTQAINFHHEQVISIFNSSSYRLGDYLEAGDLTLENTKDIIMPMQNDGHIFKLSGAEISSICFDLREKRERKEAFSLFSPLLTVNTIVI